MKVKNISNKIVHLGTTTLMPDSEAIVSDEIGNSSPVKAIIDLGVIAVVEASPVEVNSEEMSFEEPAKKGRGKKAKADILTEEVE